MRQFFIVLNPVQVYGGSPHMRGVESAQWKGNKGGFVISSLDVPILVTGMCAPHSHRYAACYSVVERCFSLEATVSSLFMCEVLCLRCTKVSCFSVSYVDF